MPDDPIDRKLAAQASFIFKGTVRKMGASTMRAVPATKNTIVVEVDDVIEAPEALEDYEGQKITVELIRARKVKTGEQYIFYGNGWVFGDSLAVQAVAQTAPPAAPGLAMAAAAPKSKPSAKLRQKLANARFETADVVITGRVTNVRVPPEAAIMAAALDSPASKPISEHDPMTQEAVIQVAAVHKGGTGAAEVTVRFPRSTDVRWYRAPKFSPGQQGLFMLHKEEARRAPRVRGAAVAAALTADESAGFHTALHPADFQILSEPLGAEGIMGLHADEFSNQEGVTTVPAKENDDASEKRQKSRRKNR